MPQVDKSPSLKLIIEYCFDNNIATRLYSTKTNHWRYLKLSVVPVKNQPYKCIKLKMTTYLPNKNPTKKILMISLIKTRAATVKQVIGIMELNDVLDKNYVPDPITYLSLATDKSQHPEVVGSRLAHLLYNMLDKVFPGNLNEYIEKIKNNEEIDQNSLPGKTQDPRLYCICKWISDSDIVNAIKISIMVDQKKGRKKLLKLIDKDE